MGLKKAGLNSRVVLILNGLNSGFLLYEKKKKMKNSKAVLMGRLLRELTVVSTFCCWL